MATNQKLAVMRWEVSMPGFVPLACRTRPIAELVRKKWVRKYRRLDVTIRERNAR